MSPVCNINTPRFGPKLRCRQRDGLQPEEYTVELTSTGTQRKGNKNGKKLDEAIKIKMSWPKKKKANMAKWQSPAKTRTVDETPRMSLKLMAAVKKTRKASQVSASASDCTRDVYTFPQENKRLQASTANEKTAVLQTISKMLHENRCLRQRLQSLKSNRGLTV